MTTVTRTVKFRHGRGRRRPQKEETVPPSERVPRVARLMALAIKFDGMIRDGVVANQSELSELARVTQPRMTQIMNLLHLAPDLQEAILSLPQSAHGVPQLTERELRPIVQISDWRSQRALWAALCRRCST